MAPSLEASVYTDTPGVEPLGALRAPAKALLDPAVYGVVPPLMRACDSSTATATGSALAPPVSTRPVASEGESIVVGCSEALMSDIGACELPPDTEDSVPMSVSSRPWAPAMAMPYIGLWGLFCVSFCDIAQKTAPFVPAAVAGVVALLRMPRLMPPSACHRRPSEASMLALELGTRLPGTPSLP